MSINWPSNQSPYSFGSTLSPGTDTITVTIPKELCPELGDMSPYSGTVFFWVGDSNRICHRVQRLPKEYGEKKWWMIPVPI